MMEIKIKSADTFYEDIEDLVWQHDITYIDAVVLYCENNKLEIESVVSLVRKNENLKSKISLEAEGLHFLPKIQRLPIE